MKLFPPPPCPLPCIPEGKYKGWRNISLFVLTPIILLQMVKVFALKPDEEEEREPFVPYTFLRLRNKRFPWGDGQKSLFHNPRVNALPEGYEDEI